MSIEGFMSLVNKLHYTIDLVRDDEKTYAYVDNCLNVLENRIKAKAQNHILNENRDKNKQKNLATIPVASQQSIFSGFFLPNPQPDIFMETSNKANCKDSYKRIVDSPAYEYLSKCLGNHMETSQLVSIAEILAPKLKIPIFKDDKKKKRTIFEWFNKNWCVLLPELKRLPLHEIKNLQA